MSTKIALAGNPNCGKTTMFNSLTGTVQYVGNWPGVTVEKKEGKVKGKSDLIVTDLPGIYSLSPYTNEEVVSRDYLASGEPAAVIDIVDSTNIERNLYLTTQIMELGKPVVMALNMVDALKKSGDKIDAAKLSEKLGCPVIETVALHGKGVKEIIAPRKKGISSGFRSISVRSVKTFSLFLDCIVPVYCLPNLLIFFYVKPLFRDYFLVHIWFILQIV